MKSISFVLPCLNEENTLPQVLSKITATCNGELKNYQTEIILSDNGSTDRSIAIAESYGARVEKCSTPGYGAALRYGISKARNELIIFADADATYDFSESLLLIAEIEKGYDLVIGSRLRGRIHKEAMPFLHRYLGTPLLNSLINQLFSHGETRITDCNSGFRCFRKAAYDQWNIQSDGMEYASEMLVRAMKANARISEVPISLYPNSLGRKPHLRTWQDGMRHVLRILVDAPFFFRKTGVCIFIASWVLLVICNFLPQGADRSLIGIPAMLFALLGIVIGQMIWSTGLFISIKDKSGQGIYLRIIQFSEDTLLWVILGLLAVSLVALGLLALNWISHSDNSTFPRTAIIFLAVSIDALVAAAHLFAAHLLKRIPFSDAS